MDRWSDDEMQPDALDTKWATALWHLPSAANAAQAARDAGVEIAFGGLDIRPEAWRGNRPLVSEP